MKLDSPLRLRHFLHQHPEVSDQEKNTSKTIKSYFEENLSDFNIHQVGKLGWVMEFDTGKEGKEIMFRCELDALPIHEPNEFEHRSTIDGVSHKCGHDGHMAIIAQLGHYIIENKDRLTGKILLLFQPAEENGNGAKEVLACSNYQRLFQPDEVYALHNVPGFELGEVVCKKDNFTPAVISSVVKITGHTSHAGEPLNGKNPIYVLAPLIPELTKLDNHDTTSDQYQIITPIYSNIGQPDFGIAAGGAELGFTMRAWTTSQIRNLQQDFEDVIVQICENLGFEYEIDWLLEFTSIHNHEDLVGYVQNASKKADVKFTEKDMPFTWGEDFGLFTDATKGAMFGLGSGKDCLPLHHPEYDFPDELIIKGAKVFFEALLESQKHV